MQHFSQIVPRVCTLGLFILYRRVVRVGVLARGGLRVRCGRPTCEWGPASAQCVHSVHTEEAILRTSCCYWLLQQVPIYLDTLTCRCKCTVHVHTCTCCTSTKAMDEYLCIQAPREKWRGWRRCSWMEVTARLKHQI